MGTDMYVFLDRDVDFDMVLELASHFSGWKYGRSVEHGQGGEVLSLSGGDGLQLRVGTYGKPSQVCMGNFQSASPITEDYLFIGSGRTISIKRNERVAGDTLDNYLAEFFSSN